MSSKRKFGSDVSHRREQQKLLSQPTHAAPLETDDAILNFLSALNCPRSLSVWLLYSYNEHQQLTELSVDALHHNSAESFRNAYCATEFLSKAKFLNLPFDRKAVAFEKFKKFELLCKQTNDRFRNLNLDPLYRGVNVELLSATRRKIAHILGDFDPIEFFEYANWGPGVTTSLKGEHVSSVNKFHSESGITRDLYSLVRDMFPIAYPSWSSHLRHVNGDAMFVHQVGNSVVTVPKNAKTDRVIAVEPGINLWFQKAIGTSIRRRLQRVGIDLNHQSHNQRLAKEGSTTGLLATVDFSSASDSISRLVVEELLPPDWFKIMSLTRSVVGVLDKDVIRWEKFSSMGNGFTFELESLIFYAAASAVAESERIDGSIYIHGDDVIIPSPCVERFTEFSAFLGFRVNSEKTHVSSPFRESCGEHFYSGSSCKPIYLKDRLRNVETFYKLANSIRLLAHRCNFNYGCDARFKRCWNHLYRRVPKQVRFGIPAGTGDGGFVCNFDEATPVRSKDGIEGYTFRGVTRVSVKSDAFEGEGLLLAALSGDKELFRPLSEARMKQPTLYDFTSKVLPTVGHGNFYDLRGRSKLRIAILHVHQWYNLGPWC